ncbi:type I restriction endonuclease subunit R [Acinetobacter nectaris]|uniref:type I restriction endonuclease subunit R n=1 Tax=Acinetobacter nectaris TaxID=1219382 RepID=UPI001F427343|nr:DEAD/DEAH box helicase family protein [Acinetobacter nectaris]MCF8999832.1 type I restriction endonuclease subunit R [Acinetobacter nectaris]MCF9026745.1 type I restriction endonuclease subunit R [Acinetobacter nectaris]
MHSEYYFEQAIENSLTTVGGYVKGNPKDYDPNIALFPQDVIAFIQATQPKVWEKIHSSCKENTIPRIISDLTHALDSKGVLSVLRQGFKCFGQKIKMAYFSPNSKINKTTQQQYDENILKCTRQVRTEFNEIPDMVLSLNGIPLITIELKNEFSASGWNVEDAKIQYKKERNPKGRLFEFKKRTLVHFAVDTCEVYMTTKLDGENTFFLPFNKGNKNDKGNPIVEGNVRTHYLWTETLARHSMMEIIARFMHLSVEEKKVKTDTGFRYIEKETMIFPRYHQLDAVRKLINHSHNNGAGHNYLIQHSAGSGKSNTIAWLAHQLASLHNNENNKIFNSIIVVTDRIVLDRQLQDTITQFEHKDGVVQKIDKDTLQLTNALASNVPIIITTIQKFPHIMRSIRTQEKKGIQIDLSTEGKNFAIIVDEAHSSQSGETAMELRKVLNKDGIEAAIAQEFLDDHDDESELTDDVKKYLFMEASKRNRQHNLSFFAFTATPKWKTLACFDEAGENGEAPFHHYSMKQAIAEGFILDVLANYTTYGQYYKLIKIADNDPEMAKNKTKALMARFVAMHPSVIAQKVEIIVEHFKAVTLHRIGGRAKAMVVTDSREQAIRYKLAFDEYIKEKKYTGIKSLVAFSGKLKVDGTEFTEPKMNGFREAELPDQFDTDDYKVLLVAEKYQTGFDQPLLHTMFVDKKLSGIQAVQTLSRLNRCAYGKEDTFVLDFVNSHEDIRKAFKPFYELTTLGDVPTEQKLNELGHTLDEWKFYFETDLNEFANTWFKPRSKLTNLEHQLLNSIIDRAVEKYKKIYLNDKLQQQTQQQEFKSQLQSYLNLYLFVSQVIDFTDSDYEKRYAYLKFLLQKLPKGSKENNIDLSKVIELQFYRLQKLSENSIDLGDGEGKALKGSTDVGTGQADATDNASNLIDELNKVFGTDFTVADQLFFDQIEQSAIENEEIMQAVNANNLDSFTAYLSNKLIDLFLTRIAGNEDICNKVMSTDELRQKVAKRLAKHIYTRAKKTGS